MNGIYNWLNYLNENFRLEFGQEWDAEGTIRAAIKGDLAMISSGNVDWPKLIADGERLGIAVEQEEQNFPVQSVGIRPAMMATGLMRCGLIELSCPPR
jgi:hypothetical protein